MTSILKSLSSYFNEMIETNKKENKKFEEETFMKNKKFASLLLSLGLIGAIGTGATLAYLSDQTAPLTNTFTFVDNGINIELWETKVNPDTHFATSGKVVAGVEKGNEYLNVVANEKLMKNPTIDVLPDSVDCFVFASIDTANVNVSITDQSKKWLILETVGTTTYYVYAEDGKTPTLVKTSNTRQSLPALFETVKIGDVAAGADLSTDDIVIKASAVQAEKINGALVYNNDVQTAGLGLLKK